MNGSIANGSRRTTPDHADLNWIGLDFSAAKYEQVTSLDAGAWKAELALHDELFKQLAYHLPTEMAATKAKIDAQFSR